MSSTAIAQGQESPLLSKERGADLLRLGLLTAALAIGFVPIFQFIGSMIWFREFLGDYQVFWINGSAPLELNYGRWLFPYPPTTLAFVKAFGLFPFWPSFFAWGLAGAAAICLASRRMIGPRALAIGLCSCAAVTTLASGQISLFVGALVIAGLSAGEPRWRGAFLAAAAVLKPQSLLAAPVAMIARRDWRAIRWAIATAVTLILISVALFGFEIWPRWVMNLPKFQAYLLGRHTDLMDVGIYGIARSFGLPGWIFLAGIPLGIATSWLMFRRESSIVDRYSAFVCSTVLMSPYTLPYDLAGLSLACTAMLLDRERSPAIWIAAALIVSSVFANVGIILMAALLSYEALSTSHTSSSAASPR